MIRFGMKGIEVTNVTSGKELDEKYKLLYIS